MARSLALLIVLLNIVATRVMAGTAYGVNDLWDLPLEKLMAIQVTTVASGTRTPVSRAASTVTVITRDDIQAIGATDIDQVLETVPGLHVTRSDQAYFPKYIFRGITSAYNAETLLMINGIPVKTLFSGTRSHVWAGMPVKAIERIEVIRGPGSALYGADAFAGVINIITRNGNDIQENEDGIRAGSFDTWGAWVQQHATLGDTSLGLVAEYQDTNGQHQTVPADAQTYFDSLTGTQASLAPGPVNTGYQAADLRLDIKRDRWRYRLGYQFRDNIGTTVGVAQALDPAGLYRSKRINGDITYHTQDWQPDWDLQAQISFYHDTQEAVRPSILFPPGANLGSGVFPNGMLGAPSYQENQGRIDLTSAYQGFARHIVRLGTGGFWGDIYKVKELKNFDTSYAPLPGGLTDVSNTPGAFLTENQQVSWYGFAQDEWRIREHTALTTGLRFDHYSDFGDTTNPRVALVHEWMADLSTRLSYGRAFHAPSFIDLYATNNPVLLGNPNLKPETIDTWELSLNHQFRPNLHYSVTLFHNRIHDAFLHVNNLVQNAGKRKGHGGEFEFTWQVVKTLRLVGNYSYQHSTDITTDSDVGDAPNQEAYLREEWKFATGWQWTSELLWVGDMPRAQGDVRSPMRGYTTFNTTFTRKQLWQHVDLSLAARNLFNASVREPSPAPGLFMPNDFPQAGRSLIAEASWRWQ